MKIKYLKWIILCITFILLFNEVFAAKRHKPNAPVKLKNQRIIIKKDSDLKLGLLSIWKAISEDFSQTYIAIVGMAMTIYR